MEIPFWKFSYELSPGLAGRGATGDGNGRDDRVTPAATKNLQAGLVFFKCKLLETAGDGVIFSFQYWKD